MATPKFNSKSPTIRRIRKLFASCPCNFTNKLTILHPQYAKPKSSPPPRQQITPPLPSRMTYSNGTSPSGVLPNPPLPAASTTVASSSPPCTRYVRRPSGS